MAQDLPKVDDFAGITKQDKGGETLKCRLVLWLYIRRKPRT